MTDIDARVRVLPAIEYKDPTRNQARAIPLQGNRQIMAHPLRTGLDAAHFQMRIRIQHRVAAPDQAHGVWRGLKLQQVQAGTGMQRILVHDIAKMTATLPARMVFDETKRRTFAQLDDIAQLPIGIRSAGTAQHDQMQQRLHLHPGRNPDHRAVAWQRRVEAREHLGIRIE